MGINDVMAVVDKHMDAPKEPIKDDKAPAAPSLAEAAKPTAQPAEAVTTPVSDEPDWSKLPAHLHPAFKEQNQRYKRERERAEKAESILKDPRITRLLAEGKEVDEQPKAAHKTPEAPKTTEDAQKLEAIKILRAELGLDPLESTAKEAKEMLQELRKEAQDQKWEKAQEGISKKAEDLGLDWESEVEPALRDWYKSHPEAQGDNAHKYLKTAFSDMFFDRHGELQERAALKKQAKEREEKKLVGSEAPAGSAPTSNQSIKATGVVDYVTKRMEQFPGGIQI